jgi:hypothetical protein
MTLPVDTPTDGRPSRANGQLVYKLKTRDEFLIIYSLNPLNAELNPVRHLLALVGAHLIVHVGRVRVNEMNNLSWL